jgi:anti-sigma-K factor RskA
VVKVMRDDVHVLSGSYVLDAVSEPEREAFERHLQHCSLCQDEVRGLRETAARLALAKAVAPPPLLRPRVLGAAHRTRQLPPTATATDRLGLEHRRARVTALFAARLGHAQHGTERRPLIPRLAATLAAAAAVVIVTLSINQAVTRPQPGGGLAASAPAASAAISRVVAAPDARTETARTTVGGTVTVVVSADDRAAVISAQGMRSLPATETYQLWVISPSGARSAGLLSGTGQIAPILAGGVDPGDRIGITVEPAGGTSTPTTAPVLAVPV